MRLPTLLKPMAGMTPSETVAVFGASGSSPGDEYYVEGERCGRLLAEAGFAVATGGYGGTMEAVSAGASSVGGTVVGVTAPSVFPDRSGGNRHLTVERSAESLVQRIADLAENTAASIALWGSLGTATELLVAWNLAYVAPFSGSRVKPVIAVGDPWRSLIPVLGRDLRTDASLVEVVDDVDAAVRKVSVRLRGDA